MLESAPGTYHFAYMDTTIKACGDYGVDVLMTLIPYADWASGCNTPHPQCDIFTGGGDYYFLNNNITGPLCPTDTLHWYNFVHTLVERYDGDGTDDMPGLAQPVLWYEFGNEPEGPCGNYDSAAYVRDYLTTLRALRDACPTCQLTNGGHLNSNDSLFWHYVIDHLAPHLGVGNIHVNEGKLAPVFGFAPYTGKAYSLFRNRLAANGSTAPLWMTEWGVYSGQPTTPLGDTLPLRTERAQAALYAKYATWGWANGLSLYYYDLKGTASNGIGSSALFEDGPTKKWRLAGLTVKLFDYFLRDATNGQQFVFATDPQLGAGHFRFVRNGLPLDVVWGLQNLPGNWQGQVVVWDVMGNADTLLIQQLPTPLGPEPRIIEWLPATGTPGVQPNPLASVVAQPNPLGPAAELTLHLAHPVPAWHIEAFAPNGQRVLQAQATGSTHTLPLAHLPAGVYALRLRAGAHTHTLRLWVP
jgi:hypothetical protein